MNAAWSLAPGSPSTRYEFAERGELEVLNGALEAEQRSVSIVIEEPQSWT